MPALINDIGFSRFIREIEDNLKHLKRCVRKNRGFGEVIEANPNPDTKKSVEDALFENRNLNNNLEEDIDIEPLLREVEYLCISPRRKRKTVSHLTFLEP